VASVDRWPLFGASETTYVSANRWPLFGASEITYQSFTGQIKTGLCGVETTSPRCPYAQV